MAGDKNKLTEKQRQILEYLKQEILQRGFPPSVREICEAVSLRSTSSVHAHLETLERKGYIKRDATKPRAIEICDEGFHTGRLGAIQGIASEDTASQSEVAQIPLIGKVAAGEPILAVENIEGYFPMPVDRLPNAEGERTTPSIVAFTKTGDRRYPATAPIGPRDHDSRFRLRKIVSDVCDVLLLPRTEKTGCQYHRT